MINAAFLGTLAPPLSGAGPADPFFGQVKALGHYDGNLADQVSPLWTNGGDVVVSTLAPKFGTGCAEFPGTAGSYLQSPSSADFQTLDGQFTREIWFRATGTPANAYIFDSGSGNQRVLLFNASGRIAYYDPVLGVSGDLFNNGPSNAALCDGSWHHLMISKDASGVVRAAADGVIWGAVSSSYNDGATVLWLGRYGGGGSGVVGWMDEHRFTKGVCRYTSDFSPPSSAFPNS